MRQEWLGPAEMARRLGVSPKALRVYESRDLVAPLRTAKGWRVYGPVQAARLHQILALKALGLSLSRIGEVLAGDLASLDAVLAVQEQALELHRNAAARALSLVATARATLQRNGALSLDALTTLTKETVMSDPLKLDDPAFGAAFKPLIDRHFNPEDQEALDLPSRGADADMDGYDQEAVSREWEALFAEARRLHDRGDETSARAFELARRWRALVDLFSGGDAGQDQKARAVWTDAMADPDLAPRLPVGPEIFAFVGRISARIAAKSPPAVR